MNVLFLSDNMPSPTMGGVEKVVSILKDKFAESFGWNCVCAYFREEDDTSVEKNVIKVDLNTCTCDLQRIIEEYKIDIISNNVMSKQVIRVVFPSILKIRENNTRPVSHVYTYHSCPGYELITQDVSFLLKKMSVCGITLARIKDVMTQLVLRITPKAVLENIIRKKYELMTLGVDRIVCLSEGLQSRLLKLSSASPKLMMAIPNPIPLNSEGANKKREKNVLIVSRLDETSKRLSKALQIWGEIEKDGSLSEWNLTIVGDGEDRPVYERMVQDDHLKRVSFEGRRNPLPYYETYSIFLITSKYEGFSLTILEAQQSGVAVMGLHSDDFPTLHDFVKDGENGFIAQSTTDMVQKLKRMMKDDQLRQDITCRARKSVLAYEMDKTISKWGELFESLMFTKR